MKDTAGSEGRIFRVGGCQSARTVANSVEGMLKLDGKPWLLLPLPSVNIALLRAVK